MFDMIPIVSSSYLDYLDYLEYLDYLDYLDCLDYLDFLLSELDINDLVLLDCGTKSR